MRTRTLGTQLAALALVGASVAVAANAAATPVLRQAQTQRGDLVVIGNTLGQDCANGAPSHLVAGTLNCAGMTNTADFAPDPFWQSDSPVSGQALASVSVGPTMARSTALLAAGSATSLQLPVGATVTYARLYWGATLAAGSPNQTAVLDGPGAMSAIVTADASNVVSYDFATQLYQNSADVTALVAAWGTGGYRVSGIDTQDLRQLDNNNTFAGWSLVLFYQSPGAGPIRSLTLYDGLDLVSAGSTVGTVLTGFVVPPAAMGFDAKFGVVGYLGKALFTGDSMVFGGTTLSNAENPGDNFFNSTRSILGNPVSVPGDLPQFDGHAASLSGMDLDVVDVAPLLAPGSYSAQVQATTTGDNFAVGAYVLSVVTLAADFSGTVKTVTDESGHPGDAVLPGDLLTYTISTTNSGSDASDQTTVTDALPAGVTYVPGSIKVLTGPLAGPKTDAAGDDQAEYTAATRTVTVRLGTGATAFKGGALAVGQSSSVSFRVTIDPGTLGDISNHAVVTAVGQAAEARFHPLPSSWSSSGNGLPGGGAVVTVKTCTTGADCPMDAPACNHFCVICAVDSDCAGKPGTPICDAGSNTCRACTSDADCSGATPSCDQLAGSPSQGACVACVSDAGCPAALPRCDPAQNECVQCLGLADCGGVTPVCDAAHACQPCASDASCVGVGSPPTPVCEVTGASKGACGQCSPTNLSQCAGAHPLCDAASYACVACETDKNCAGATPFCDPTGHVCAPCTKDGDCSGSPGGAACVTAGSKVGACVACVADANCGGSTPRCDLPSNTCVACLAAGDCAGATPACDGATHTCVPCVDSTTCKGATPVCTSGHACEGCQGDFVAANPPAGTCPTSALPACQAGGALGGQCTQCDASNTVRCDGSALTPVCVVAKGVCGCLRDTDCAAGTYCDVAAAATGSCQPGCLVAGGVDTCPVGSTCDHQDGTPGVCQAPVCATNADCTVPPDLVCDQQQMPPRCVQCATNGDCASLGAGTLCLVDHTCGCATSQDCASAAGGATCRADHLCGCATSHDCTPAGKGAVCLGDHACGCATDHDCTPAGQGAVCLGDHACGCTMDADCGGPASGRTCSANHVCVQPGSAASGGNGGSPRGSYLGGGSGDCAAAAAGADRGRAAGLGVVFACAALAARRRRSPGRSASGRGRGGREGA